MNGAYKTTVKYHAPAGRAEYRDALPVLARGFVIHDPAGMASMDGSSVAVVLSRAIFRRVTPGDPIPGTLWDPDYVWPDDTPPPVVPVDAPVAERTAFITAVLALRNAITPAIVTHYKTHDDPDDPIVRAVEYLIALGNRAEGLSK